MKKHSIYIRQNFLLAMYRNYVYNIGRFLIGKSVLEVGANKGTLFKKYFRSVKSHMLLEPNEHFREGYEALARKYDRVHYEINDFKNFKTTEKFDTVLMIAVISHIKWDPRETFAKIDSLLKPGGTLVIETNNTKKNLEVMDYCKNAYNLIEAKKSYTGLLKWLKIDDRDVFVYTKRSAASGQHSDETQRSLQA
jgi:2-polyprenyl-3-methyl-5-hydroxy-6-metoxy-1,4-benzoquinol methylase